MSSSEVWDAANAICAIAARQSRCDANAALTIWDAVDAAIAIGAALPSLQQSGGMLTLQQIHTARC